MSTPARYSLVTWPESQNYVGNPGCILACLPGSTYSAYLVPEAIAGPLDPRTAYVRVGWPESQKWDRAPEGRDKTDVLHDYESADAWVLQPLYEEAA